MKTIKDLENVIEHLENRNLEQQQKIEELETQLLQYQAYIADITTTIQKNICKDFCPNINISME